MGSMVYRRLFWVITTGFVFALVSCRQAIPATTDVAPEIVDTPVAEITISEPETESSPVYTTTPNPTSTRRVTPTPSATPTLTLTPASWNRLAAGVEERMVPVQDEIDPNITYYVYALRIDPSKVSFQVHYEAGVAHTIEEWQAETNAPIILNGGFFSGNYTPVGRIVSEGVMYGFPLNYGEGTIGVAGLFTVLDGDVEMYSIGRSSYSPRGMRFDEAIESYPILLLPGRQPTYPRETGENARRTVIGLDDQQRVIILICDLPIFSLHELSGWLAQSDLNFDTALNLDGGRSTGIAVALPGSGRLIPSYVPVPIALAIYPER
jgi:uncharacterized protein YigE (DUF2233 family)